MSTIKRTIGVEIECILPNDLSRDAASAIRAAGADVGGDGSISTDDGHGYEIRTKPMKGEEAEAAIRSIASALNGDNAKVNTSCGLHVHADAGAIAIQKLVRHYSSGYSLAPGQSILYVHRNTFAAMMDSSDQAQAFEIIDVIESGGSFINATGQYGDGLMVEMAGIRNRLRVSPSTGRYVIPDEQREQFYACIIDRAAIRAARQTMYGAMRFFGAVDTTIRSFVSASRRHNNYCQPFEKITGSGGTMPRTLREVYARVSDRYCGINMQALAKHGTLENRYHSGSINGEKIVHWARMWARCVDVALSHEAIREADALCEMVNSKSRMDMFLALLALPDDTEAYLRERVAAFGASDGKHAATYIKNKKALVCAV